MNNLLSYCGLVDARISASEKDLPVQLLSNLAVRSGLVSDFQKYVPQGITGKTGKTALFLPKLTLSQSEGADF